MLSETGYLNLVNGTTLPWDLTSIQSYDLKVWDFPQTLDAGAQYRCTIETEHSSSASGTASYVLRGTNFTFDFLLSIVDEQVVLQASWNGTDGIYLVFPPPLQGTHQCTIGWSSGGTVAAGVFFPNSERLPQAVTDDWRTDWMYYYSPFMAAQKLCSLTLPGTHDSGTYDMVVPLPIYTKCQDLDFTGQLSVGTRYFDMRIGFQPQYDDDWRFLLVHEEIKTYTTLADALGQISGFLQAHPAEILILDFHRFTNFAFDPPVYDGPTFPYAELTYWIQQGLGDHLFAIPSNMAASDVTLNDIYATAGRVLVSFNTGDYTNRAYIPPITQEWKSGLCKSSELEAFIASVMESPPSGVFWAMMAAINCPPFHPPHSLAPDIDNWFYGGSDWSMKANAIPTDFIEKTALVSNSVCSSVLKGTRG